MERIIIEGITTEDFIERVSKKIASEILPSLPKQSKPSEYITRKEAAEFLGISLVTVYHWCKKGILKSYRINSRVRFKREEVEEALQEVPNQKYRRG